MKFSIFGLAEKLNKLSLSGISRVTYVLGCFVICTIWVIFYYQIKYDYERTLSETSKETMNLAQAFEEHVRRVVSEADKDLINLTQAYERDGITSPEFNACWATLGKDPSRGHVHVINEQGRIIKSTSDTMQSLDRSDREYYFHHKKANDELYIGKLVISRITDQPVIPLSRRINMPAGSFGGVVSISLKSDYFLSFYERIDLGENQSISLTGLDGYSRARRTKNIVEGDQDIKGGELWKRVQTGHPFDSYLSTNLLDGITRINSYRVMSDYPLIVAVGKSTNTALKEFKERKQAYIIFALVLSFLILAYCRLFIDWYAKQRSINMELSRLDRLNLVGEMAASIGHEVRNPLTTVRGYLQWFLRKDILETHKQQLGIMIEELDRANSIITEFLSLAKNKAVKLKPGNINNVLDALYPLLQAEAYHYGHDLQMVKNNVFDVLLDDNEIRQLVLNLVRNGFEAMETSMILTIKSYMENNYVVLCVRDMGGGIPESIVDKLGTPFITTKDNGTGLGLAVCYRIADRHNAKIDFTTSDEGTTFYIKFPVNRV